MLEPGPASRLMILFDEDRTWNQKPLVEEIVGRARSAGLAGASAFRGVEGFGSSRQVHTSRILDLSDGLPIMVLIVDSAAKIDRFLSELVDLDTGGVITVDDVVIAGRDAAERPS